MTLQQLRYVTEIARCGSFSRAADNLLVSQPSLSTAVSSLESELMITLFVRTSRGVKLSPEGQEFTKYAVSLLEQADALKSRFSGKVHEEVRFSVSSQHYSFVADAFVKVMNGSDCKDTVFSLREGRTTDIIEDVQARRSEIGILYLSDSTRRYLLRLFDSKSCEFVPLKKVTPHVFVRPGHPLLSLSEASGENLEPYPFIYYEQGEVTPLILSEELLVLDAPRRKISVQDRATMENIIGKTDAYTIGTGYIIPGITGVTMASVPLKNGPLMEIGYIKNKNTPLSKEAEQFCELLSQSLDQWENNQ